MRRPSVARWLWASLLVLSSLGSISIATAGDIIWAIAFSGAAGSSANGIAVNPVTGHSHAIGTFQDQLSIGAFNLTAHGPSDVFMASIDPAGHVICATNFGGVNATAGIAVAADRDGSTYNVGNFRGTLNVGTQTLVNEGVQGIFLIKLNASTCEPEFALRYGGQATNYGNGVTVDVTERPYIVGAFQGEMDFVNSTYMGNFSLVSHGPKSDLFLLRIGRAGAVLWGKSYGSVGADWAEAVGTDLALNSYVTGSFQFNLTTNSTNATPPVLYAAGIRDIVIMQHHSYGNITWAKAYGGEGGINIGRAIAVDGAGYSYTTGVFQNRMTVGATTLVSNGRDDGFVIKLDPDGNEEWAVSFGGRGDDEGYSIALDPSGPFLYVTGTFEKTMVIARNALATADLDAFVIKMSTIDGRFIWGREIGNKGLNHGYGISCDMVGNPIVVGDFEKSIDLGEGVVLEATGEMNYFVLKLAATSAILTPDWSPSHLKVARRPSGTNRTVTRDAWSFQGRLAVPAGNPLFTGAFNPFKFLILLLDGNNVDYYSSVSFPPGACAGTSTKGRGRFVCTRASSNGTEATLKLVETRGKRAAWGPSSPRTYKVVGRVKRDNVFPIPERASLQVVMDFNTAVYWQPRPLLPCKHSRKGDRVSCG